MCYDWVNIHSFVSLSSSFFLLSWSIFVVAFDATSSCCLSFSSLYFIPSTFSSLLFCSVQWVLINSSLHNNQLITDFNLLSFPISFPILQSLLIPISLSLLSFPISLSLSYPFQPLSLSLYSCPDCFTDEKASERTCFSSSGKAVGIVGSGHNLSAGNTFRMRKEPNCLGIGIEKRSSSAGIGSTSCSNKTSHLI